MSINKANHICKNKNCPHGINGEPKHYYACNYCDRTNQWRSMACCPECYDEYIKQVLEARSKKQEVNLLPQRTDKTEEEVVVIMNTPEEVVLEETKSELSEYLKDSGSISEAIDTINKEISLQTTKKTKKNKTSKSFD